MVRSDVIRAYRRFLHICGYEISCHYVYVSIFTGTGFSKEECTKTHRRDFPVIQLCFATIIKPFKWQVEVPVSIKCNLDMNDVEGYELKRTGNFSAHTLLAHTLFSCLCNPSRYSPLSGNLGQVKYESKRLDLHLILVVLLLGICQSLIKNSCCVTYQSNPSQATTTIPEMAIALNAIEIRLPR